MTRKRCVGLLGAGVLWAGVLVAGGIGAPLLLTAGSAQAASCGTATTAGVSCSLTGTLGLTSGDLSLTPPGALGWGTTVTGVDQQLADTTSSGADETYLVNDASGSGAGWHVTAAATTFTRTVPTAATLANTGTFVTNGSVTLESDTAAPTTACSSASACTLPTNTTTYPVGITTATSTPPVSTIYDASAATGLGSIIIGGSSADNPVGWWLNVPAATLGGTYTSTVTLALISAP